MLYHLVAGEVPFPASRALEIVGGRRQALHLPQERTTA